MMDKHGEHIVSAAAITAATVVAVTRRRDMVVGIAALVAYLAGWGNKNKLLSKEKTRLLA